MSVDYTQAMVKFAPINRDPNDKTKYALLGRWLGGAELLGDASGGNYLFHFYLGLARGLFPSPVLADCRSLSVFDVNGNLGAGGYGYLTLYSGESVFGTTTPFQHTRIFNFPSTSRINYSVGAHGFNLFPDWKFPINRESPTFVDVLLEPNTNGHTLYVYVGGYIWDERYLDN